MALRHKGHHGNFCGETAELTNLTEGKMFSGLMSSDNTIVVTILITLLFTVRSKKSGSHVARVPSCLPQVRSRLQAATAHHQLICEVESKVGQPNFLQPSVMEIQVMVSHIALESAVQWRMLPERVMRPGHAAAQKFGTVRSHAR